LEKTSDEIFALYQRANHFVETIGKLLAECPKKSPTAITQGSDKEREQNLRKN